MSYIFMHIHLFILHGYIRDSQHDQLPVGLIAQLVEHCTGIAEAFFSQITARVVVLFNLSPAVQIYVPYIHIQYKTCYVVNNLQVYNLS